MGLFNKKKEQDNDIKNSLEKVETDLTIDEIKQGKTTKKDKAVVASSKKNISKQDSKEAYKYLIKPLITEKATHLKVQNKYLFLVDDRSTKNEIKKAVFHVYGYNPESVNIINLGGKKVKFGRTSGVRKCKKKAIVTLKKGDSIEIYEGV
ncbi:MAG: 50S ribosomal protein L23 [Patescibacteria group bacterium]|nr:50S ribosomal protein L23 [Patescibacteria group bacterium]MDD4304611.1 50S ribosomal protein L23 [Patescibacteria group bacterium]MDD4695538.1 50S ribosomal protein L23 [Patescibacteria group bacterium]